MNDTANIASRINAYIAQGPDWAQAQCNTLRSTILAADAKLAEIWKWKGPCYEHNGLVCGFDMAKSFVSITFFRGSEMADAANAFNHCVDNAHNRSIRFEQHEAIDTALITRYVQAAVALNQAGPKPKMEGKRIAMPDELAQLLATHADARIAFEGFAPYKQRDYIEWIATAKRAETRQQRLDKALANLKAGLGLNDKYKA
ncbi:MAG: YdeI/OmpD-associated family protein [Burkholderiales bacterium]|nr:YdeI/OmpD-associated family protein [Burkholderiales bacterium]